MKKQLTTLLAAALLTSTTTPVLANPVQPDSLPQATRPGEMETVGTIGGSLTGVIEVSVPENVHWWVTDGEFAGLVQSPNFTIENNSEHVNLEVTLVSYLQTDGVNVSDFGILTVNLTDDLLEGAIGQDIIGKTGGDTAFTNLLLSRMGDEINASAVGVVGSRTFNFGFDGEFIGSIPVRAITPTYSLVLEFAVHSFTVDPTQ